MTGLALDDSLNVPRDTAFASKTRRLDSATGTKELPSDDLGIDFEKKMKRRVEMRQKMLYDPYRVVFKMKDRCNTKMRRHMKGSTLRTQLTSWKKWFKGAAKVSLLGRQR